ncbi:MAG: HAD family hydrolase [Gammaproteobacteria bacterium]
MDAIANRQSEHTPIFSEYQTRAVDLLSMISSLPPQIKVLSLDCFDTIIFRKAFAPTDVFYDLQHKPAFKELGYTAFLRMSTESRARGAKKTLSELTEVCLNDIYRAGFPDLTTKQVDDLSNEELEAEIETCFAFPAMVEVIRAAKQRGLSIIVVSDTYFNEKQLTKLLSHALPDDALAAISKIFCSADYGIDKHGGLFEHVLKEINHPPQAFLHVGDNPTADFNAANTKKMNALHLYHHNKNIINLLRMQEIAACFFDGNIRHKRSLSSPYRAIFAETSVDLTRPEVEIGYYSLGQIMYSFAHFIRDEVQKLKQLGKNTKVLFLMRDAYLPSLICEAINGEPMGPRVRISRFAAIASGFRTEKDINRYLTYGVASQRFSDLARQLLLPKGLSDPIIEKANKAEKPQLKFLKSIQKPDVIKFIIKASSAYRKRMMRHLEKEADIKAGDTLVFVDLGYTGTAQVELTPIFKDMDIEVVGRYLISLQSPGWEANRSGLLDSSWCDHRTMQTLIAYVALLEQLCTSNDASVVDFQEDGTPIFSKSKVNDKQGMKNEPIHEACVRFAKDAEAIFTKNKIGMTSQMLRDITLAELGRLLFLPTQTELDYFLSFQFDLNMGTEDLLRIFDLNSGLEGMRKRGLFFMERNVKSYRTNYPAELRSAGAELVLTLMAGHRFGLDFRPDDISYRKEKLDILIVKNGHALETNIDAKYTYDGYFSAVIPLGKGDIQAAVLFGKHYRWLEIDSINLISVNSLFGASESQDTIDGSSFTATEHLTNRGGKLYECANQNAFLAYMPNLNKEIRLNPDLNYVMRIIFRPTVKFNAQKKMQ